MADARSGANPSAGQASGRHGRIVRRYFLVVATLVGGSLFASVMVEMGFRFQETRQNLDVVHRNMAQLAAMQIHHYIDDVAQAVRFAAQPRQVSQGRVTNDYITELRSLLRNVPAIRDVIAVNLDGREQLRVSRIGRSLPDENAVHSSDPFFKAARGGETYFGPVIFPADSFEPRIVIAVPIEPFRGEVIGVLAAEVNVRYVWDVVQEIHVGEAGYAYVVADNGILVAHPDLHLVLQRKDLSEYAPVAALHDPNRAAQDTGVYENINGQRVFVAHMRIPSVGWTVLVERPLTEAYRPLLASLGRTGGILLVVCILAIAAAVLLGRRVVRPIEVLRQGAARLEAGQLDARLEVKTGDEFEELAEDFNRMAHRLQDSYATLERKVEERTHQLELANLAKSRFLATASHDLRQPLHALGLFAAQLNSQMSGDEQSRIVERINDAIADMNELFTALLDISKLDAGVLTPNFTDFPIAHLLRRIESTFAEAAREKNLSLRVVSSSAWVRSDVILLERILLNLVSNAVRYTARGGVVVGCRKRDGRLRIEVWDSGPGIPEDQRQNIFGEFYRVGDPDRDQRGGLGLGLAIVDRLCRLIDQPVELQSHVGRGSRFTVVCPRASAQTGVAKLPAAAPAALDTPNGKLVVVIDDDAPILEGMGSLLRSWGCRVVTGSTETSALSGLAEHDRRPDLIISDYRLSDGKTGVDVIARLRSEFSAPIPAFLISGDTNPEPLLEARANGYSLLHKPVDPMTLRAILNRMLQQSEPVRAHQKAETQSAP